MISFVSVGSHANYPNNGEGGKHDILLIDASALVFASNDFTSPGGQHFKNESWVERGILDDDSLPAWIVKYEGKWGIDVDNDILDGFSGPRHPYHFENKNFTNPIQWAGIDKIGERTVAEVGIDTVNFVNQKTQIVFETVLDVGTTIIVDLHDEFIQLGENLKEITFLPHFWDIESSLINNTFNAEIIFNYNPAELNPLGINEQFLNVFGFNESQNIWQKVPSVLNPVTNTISFFTSHFSRYAIGAENWQDITGDVKIVKNPKNYDKNTGVRSIDVKLKNETDESITNDLRLVIKDISKEDIEFLNPTGLTQEGNPYLDIGQPYNQCIFTGAEQDLPLNMSKGNKKNLLEKNKPLEQGKCESIIKKYPEIKDMIEYVLAPNRFTQDIKLQFSVPTKKDKKFDFEVEVRNKVAEF